MIDDNVFPSLFQIVVVIMVVEQTQLSMVKNWNYVSKKLQVRSESRTLKIQD